MMWLHVLLGGIALFWLGALLRVVRSRADTRFRLGVDAPVIDALPRLAVIVPARDEARNIGACVASVLGSDHPRVELLVFDDGSSDGTADIARAAGARVVEGGAAPLPEGWMGKPWALKRAASETDADWICFVDADVRLHPGALSRVHSYAVREDCHLLSGFGKLVMGSFWEKVIQPSVGGLIIAGNDLAVVNDPERPDKAIANGQLILVQRGAYEGVGGHEAVRDNILDYIGLALAIAGKGFRARCLFMRELFSCRMYTGLAELWRGWTKNLFPGMRYRLDAVALVVGMVLVEFIAPYVIFLFALSAGDVALVASAAAVLVLVHGVRAYMDGIFEQERAYGLLQPLGALVLLGLLLDSVRRTRAGTREWKGRIY